MDLALKLTAVHSCTGISVDPPDRALDLLDLLDGRAAAISARGGGIIVVAHAADKAQTNGLRRGEHVECLRVRAFDREMAWDDGAACVGLLVGNKEWNEKAGLKGKNR
jgi:hypothetical protein